MMMIKYLLLLIPLLSCIPTAGYVKNIDIKDTLGTWGRTDTILLRQSWRVDTHTITISEAGDSIWFVEKTFSDGYSPVIKRALLETDEHLYDDTLTARLDYIEPEYYDRSITLVKNKDSLWVSNVKYIRHP